MKAEFDTDLTPVERRTLRALETIAEAFKPHGVPIGRAYELRTMLAGQAMQGLLSGGAAEELPHIATEAMGVWVRDMAISSVGLADAILSALAKEPT